jgi:hypothetical protein
MDAHSLPDDPRDWPDDPFSLLGVPRSVSEADLKRAYTRLIKKYKPEHAPEEFRRIREAYEAAVEMSRWYRDAPPVRDTFRDLPFTAVPPPSPPPSPAPASQKPASQASDVPHETQIDPPVRPAPVDPVETAWADAVAGLWDSAYPALAALAEQHPHRADLPLRLYWLLALRPTLDDDRTRHDWLAAALTRSRLRGPAVELYRRELHADPQLALSGPYSGLLELPNTTGNDLLNIAAARLAVAASDERWVILDLDLTALESRASDFEESAWLAYLAELAGISAIDHLGLFCRCRELMAGLRHLELRHAEVFDRFDEQTVIAERLQSATLVPAAVSWAVTATFQGGQVSQKALDAAIVWAANDPTTALREIDAWVLSRRHLDVLSVFVQLVDRRRAGTPRADYPVGIVRGSVRAFVASKKFKNPDKSGVRKYSRVRPALLQFLLAERIDPEELVTACLVDPHPDTRILVQHVRNDEPLRLVYRTATATA